VNRQGSIAQIDADFDEWYAAYPHKVAKGQAIKAYRTARKITDRQTLLDGLASYKLNKPPDVKYCNPATWLNGQRWLDRPAQEVESFNGKSTHGTSQGQRGSIASAVGRFVAAGNR
jgi:hypothetical protein